MLPALRYVAGKSGAVPVREVSDALAKEFNLTEAELSELLPSGRAPLFYNRVQWAITHIRKALLFTTPQRGCVAITQRGIEVLSKNPKRVDMRLLAAFPEFQEFRSKKQEVAKPENKQVAASNKTPDEIIEDGYQVLRTSLAADLLDRVLNCSPAFFERLVVELIVKMGYGGSRVDAGKAFCRSGDGGLDGIIKEDRLAETERIPKQPSTTKNSADYSIAFFISRLNSIGNCEADSANVICNNAEGNVHIFCFVCTTKNFLTVLNETTRWKC